MAVRLNKTLSAFVQLAAFAANENLKPHDVAELVALAGRAFAAGERHANGTDTLDKADKADKAGEAFEAKAAALGYSVDWPGLWPVLRKGGRDVYLPSDRS